MDFYLQKGNTKFELIILVLLLFFPIANGELLPSTSINLLEVHLVRCLTHISHRYFAPGQSLVISSADTYRVVQQELIAEVQRTSIWPVVVTVDGNISIPENSDLVNRVGSYIIIIPDGNIKGFKSQINRLAEQTFRFTRLWNSEARFVVAGANEFSMSQQTNIIDHFSKMRIYNCIIVSQGHYVLGKEYNRTENVEDVDTGMKLVVYTWFPYQSSNRCTEVSEISLLDSWVISAQGHFTKNIDLFPGKISENLKGCPLKAVVRNGKSSLTINYVHYKNPVVSNRFYISGLEWDLFKLVYEQMNMTFFHVPTPRDFEIGKRSVVSLIGNLIGKKAYIALGAVGSNYLSNSFFDVTSAYHIERIRWYIPCSVKYPRWSSIFRILSEEMWFVLILSIVVVAISTTLVGRYSCTSEWQGYKTLTRSLTNVWAVILGVSVSTMPRTPSLRSLFLAWVCFSLAFSTVFQAFLTTFLIDSAYKTPIQNMDELFASGIKLAFQPQYNFIFEKGDETEASKVQRNLANCPSFKVCLNWAKYHKNVSVLLSDNLAERWYVRGDLLGENSEPLLCRLEDGVVFTTGRTMLMLHGDPLMKRVNEIIDAVVEAGLYDKWISMFVDEINVHSRKIAIVHPLDEYYSFNLYHMQPAFYLLLMGWCLSAFCFMLELLFNRVLRKIK